MVDQDLKELFGQFGPMTECRVLYERSGRSTGTAEVHFQRVADAKRARQEYNNVPLDGRDMVSKTPVICKLYNIINVRFRILCSWADDKKTIISVFSFARSVSFKMLLFPIISHPDFITNIQECLCCPGGYCHYHKDYYYVLYQSVLFANNLRSIFVLSVEELSD